MPKAKRAVRKEGGREGRGGREEGVRRREETGFGQKK